jgi:glycine oxidase
MTEVVIVGAGIIGCASALALARRGVRVTLLEGTSFAARAASTRAAGILGAQLGRHPHEAMAKLCLASRDRYPEWVASLEESGIDVGYRRVGALRVAFNPEQAEALSREVDGQTRAGLEAALLGPSEVRELEPALSEAVIAAGYFPHDAVVDPPLLLEAVRCMAERAGVSVVSEAAVVRLLRSKEKVSGALLENGSAYHGDELVLAAGSWSALVESGIPRDALAPARG